MIQTENLSYAYGENKILEDVNLRFEAGKMYAIEGTSGSGKTTLLSLLAGIDKIQDGKLYYEGKEISKNNFVKYRKQTSIVFQNYNLINYMSANQNVRTALDIIKYKGDKKTQIKDALGKVGIASIDCDRIASKLSGGQQQRVSIARALACEAKVIFADEPTGNLDSKTSVKIINLLKNLAHNENKCVVCVTHDRKLASMADEIIKIEDGKIM